MEEEGGWYDLVAEVCDSPAAYRQTLETCTYTDVARFYLSKKAREQGVGWDYPDKPDW